ncbi:MAG: efflux RND transporter periplasmic adaptor subunit [Gemmatimonadota bacterium]|nr:efflux RND transporter periplasmic adaptor subunit [Gemmatimonadota bacterium]
MTGTLGGRRSRGASIARWTVSVVVVVGAIVVARVAGRRPEPQAAPMPTAGDSGGVGGRQTVMISPADAHRIGVTYAPVTMQPVVRQIRTVGQVSYDEQQVSAIAPKLDGWVDSLFVNYTGQTVHRGDRLLTIYAPMAVAAEEELVLARRLRDRVASGTPDARRGADELLQGARRRLSYWDVPPAEIAQVESTGVVRKELTLRSPATGVVVEKAVVAGQRTMAGESLFRIVDLRSVWVQGEVFERDLPAVHLGQPVQATFEALPGVVRTGRIAFIDPVINPDTRTARVRVVLSNGDMALKPGMYATLTASAREAPHTLSVPRNAVLSTGERNIVFLKRPDGMLEPREITLGMAGDDRVAVLSGLALGDTVVATATFLVDAESNLAEALGGMGNMPGMDMSAPSARPQPGRAGAADSMAGMDMSKHAPARGGHR